MRKSTEFKDIPRQSETKLKVDAYWNKLGIKRTFLACCDCDLDYCSGKDSGCFGILWRKKKQEIRTRSKLF